MKNVSKKINYLMIGVAASLLMACGGSTPEAISSSSNKVDLGYRGTVGIYDSITLDGQFSSTIASNKLVLKSATATETLELTKSSTSTLRTFISETAVPGIYKLYLSKDGKESVLKDIMDEDVSITVQKRPVILTISKTSFTAGATIQVTGKNFKNKSGNANYDPGVYISKTGYSNSVSEISINDTDDGASIVISNAMEVGKYQLYITSVPGPVNEVGQWSNPIDIEIVK